MNQAVIGVGSNIDAARWIPEALRLTAERAVVAAESTYVTTAPVGFKEQDDFTNGAWLVHTDLDREALTAWLHEVENACGRVRTENKYGPRTIDLDVVVWNRSIIDKDYYERGFLQQAVLELLPDLESNSIKAKY